MYEISMKQDERVIGEKKENKKRELKAGDVIGVSRGMYEHYGIYIGEGRVIHYSVNNNESSHTAKRGEISKDAQVMESDLLDFLNHKKDCFILDFEHKNILSAMPPKVPMNIRAQRTRGIAVLGLMPLFWYLKVNILAQLIGLLQNHNIIAHLYTEEETVRRAKSQLGKKGYNLVFNNCEHFALWCKTGISHSYQVNRLLQMLLKVSIVVI